LTVLCYHSADPGWESPMSVRPSELEQQLAWLSRHREVISLEEAVTRLDGSARLPSGVAAVTFDDGFADLEEYALPLLLRYRIPATVFLVAQTLTTGGQPVDWVNHPPAFPLETLRLDQVLRMQDAGVSFQSHSWAHRDLTALDPQECLRDLRDSRELLEDVLGRPVRQLAYPRGRHDERVRAAAAEAGYHCSFTLPEAAERPGAHAVPRVGVHRGNSVRTLRVKTNRGYLAVRHSRAVRAVRAVRAG
jgi:peptidoglycan/xylan/chitin deacetylase (PgdA/CDA1 family)